MSSRRKSLCLPILIILLGTGWLLTAMNVVSGIDWIWILGLAAIGIVTFVVGGLDKTTVVIAPMFLAASVLSVLRQTGRLSMNIEVPILVIVLGVLMLVAHLKVIPAPKWLVDDDTSAGPQ